ncbi:TetR/AcrR family transcriptional regulator [Malaciobacter sp. WC5094]
MRKTRTLNQEKKEAILKAAIEEFFIKGYDASSMDSISKNANVSKATVYNHFKNKEELLLSIAKIFKSRIENSFKYTYSNEKNITEQLHEIAQKEMSFLSSNENIKLIQIMTIIMIQKNSIGLKIIEILNDDCLTMTSSWFEEAKQNGKLNFKSSTFVSKQFIGMIKSFAFIPQLYGSPILNEEEKEEVINKAVEMITTLYSVNKQ